MTFDKADILLFDVYQSKWTINAKYKHSSMLMFLWGSLMAPVVSVKCVLKNCTGKPSKQQELEPIHSICLFYLRVGGEVEARFGKWLSVVGEI